MPHEPSPHAANKPPGVPLRLVLLPNEHGSWSFLGEPLLLGLLVRFSWAGVALGVAALCAFLARQPLKLFVSDRQRGKIYPRTHLAERVFAALVVLAALALAAAWQLAQKPFWTALAYAAPLAALTLWFDLGKRSRDAGAELAGATALGALSTAVALAGGMRPEMAFMLWAALAMRTIPTILFVRARLRLEKGKRPRPVAAYASHGVAIGVVWMITYGGFAPALAPWAMVLLAARAVLGLSRYRPRWKTWQLGLSEVVFGLVTVACLAWGR